MANEITVTSAGTVVNASVTPDTAMYYSNKSKDWAISDKIVDNTDYSSKYYAKESKKQADISTAKTAEVVESGNTAVSNIESARNNAITDIINRENVSVENVNAAGATQVANVNSAGTTQVNLAKEQVTLATNQATIATNKTSEVVARGNTALANITTAKNNAITTITTQETTSKNNVIATGNKQVERVNLTGVDNRTPMFTKSEIETNEGVYQNVYDLKYSSGNKTGIDTIKADNYEVVGSPVISDDGVASGFSVANYIKSNSNIAFTAGQTWEIDLKVNIKNSESGTDKTQCLFQIYADNPNLNSLQAILFNNCVFWTCPTTPSGGATNRFLQFTSKFNILSYLNQDIWFKFIYNGKQYIFEWSTDGINYTQEVASTNSRQFTGTGTLNLGAMSIHQQGLQGSIDLNNTKVHINDNLAYQPCLKIPYTQSKTGSKIVDAVYRDRVIDLYEQEGQAGYYTIDEPNKNFTLPMGEIYGMIEGKADKDILNNPYSLFDSKYSDHELNNLSWLKSEGQWNAKAVYPDAYDKLLKVYNGTETVEGLSVKLSTEEYTDYDFVLNTADETFRLPLKNHTADDSNSVLTLYFYVGETVQNANLIDAGRIGEQLATKTDMLQASGASMPSDKYIDLTLGASGSTYTAPANGWFWISVRSSAASQFINLGNGISGYTQNYSVGGNDTMNLMRPVRKDEIVYIYYSVGGATQCFRFIYAEGSKE